MQIKVEIFAIEEKVRESRLRKVEEVGLYRKLIAWTANLMDIHSSDQRNVGYRENSNSYDP